MPGGHDLLMVKVIFLHQSRCNVSRTVRHSFPKMKKKARERESRGKREKYELSSFVSPIFLLVYGKFSSCV